MLRVLLSFVLLFVLAMPALAQKGGPLAPEDAFKALQVADGFHVELFASEPMLINPTSIDVDHRGRVWVCEAVNYRRKNFGRPIIRKEGDRIVVLVDINADGKADEAKTFYQSPEIVSPLGICIAPYPDGKGMKVFVCHSPDILVFEDKDGDLKADGPPNKFLTGFRGFDHDHGVHGINIGPDGKLYFTVGDAGVGGLQSSDGKGPKWTNNNTDCQKGTVWRCDMDGTNLELIAHNFRNNYECCVNSFGEVWLSDNDDDGNQQTRICFVMPGGNYGYGPRGPGQTHWHEEQPGIVHKTLRTGFGSPTGITFYEGALFDKKYTGSLLHCDAGPREVRWFHIKPKGAGHELEKEVLLTSTDNWFRPSDVCVAPDGSIIVADWYDRGVGGHGMGDPTDGRIYRITPKGHKGYTMPEVKLDTKEGVLAALSSPSQTTRWQAIQWLNSRTQEEEEEALGAALASTESGDDVLLARTMWRLSRPIHPAKDPPPAPSGLRQNKLSKEFSRVLGARGEQAHLKAEWVRITIDQASVRSIIGNLPEALNDFLKTISVPESRELLLGMRNVTEADAREVLISTFYTLAKKYDGQDHFYRAALNIACGTDPARRDAILADFDKHFPEWNDKVADLVWELRPKSVLPRLEKLLTDPKLTAAQKARVVDIIAVNDDLAAGRTMLAVLTGNAAPEMKARAVESLALFIPTKWKGLRGSKELAAAIDALLKDARSTRTGLQLIAATGATDRVDRVAEIVGDGDRTLVTRREGIRTLGRLRSAKSVEHLAAAVAFSRDTALQKEAIQSLGELADTAKDDVGPKALDVLRMYVGNSGVGDELKTAAVDALAGSRSGTIWLLDTHQSGKLPRELVDQAGRLLRNSPFQGERNRALLLFPAPGKLNPKNLPPIAELAKRAGDAAKGKAVWAASFTGAAQCSKCHMVRGAGGSVGPDLAMIGKKSAREALYESILQPSRAIADQYIQHQVTTTAEVTVAGLLVADTPESITLRDANGKDTTIPKKEIAGQVRKLKLSIMPEDVVAALTEDELADLVAYLETLKTPALTPEVFHVAGPFRAQSMEDALDKEFGPQKGPFDPKAEFRLGDRGRRIPTIGWTTIRPDGKGYFDLAAKHGREANNSASYMYAEIDSPVEQAGEVLLGVDDGARLWINGKEVFTTREIKAAAPEQHRVAVNLIKGRNAVLLKVANGNSPHGFFFSLTSHEETKVVAGK
jgi:putative membrane-bound dehydrogenase-like protein